MTRGAEEARGSRVTYVIGTYPLLTTTFIDREVELLQAAGMEVEIVALRRPRSRLSSAQEAAMATVLYVLPVSAIALLRSHSYVALRQPLTLWRLVRYLLTRPHPDLRSRAKTVLHIGEGVHVAYLLRKRAVRHIHAHFVDRAAVVGMVASRLLGCTVSATAHANDIYVDPILLPEKIAAARFVATCTEFNAAHLRAVAAPGTGERIVRLYHGLDPSRYQPMRADGPPLILAVGQLKEKKGLGHLVTACGRLRDAGYDLRCDIVGEGPLVADLQAQIRRLNLDGVVTLRGALPHEDVVAAYRSAAVFALPCVTGPDGDRDGIPNVILEAMAMGLPVVSTAHSGIPEAVSDGVTGLLVPPGDSEALASALAGLLDDPGVRLEMGRRGRQVVAETFDITANAKELLRRFEEAMA